MDNGRDTTRKILTTNDIRKHARDWSLAGDVGLLAHLERFSQNIIDKVQETQKNFEDLADEYEELHTKVGNVTNQFLALQNCQFVENRVYDEETPTEEKHQGNVKNEKEQEKLLLMHYKEAVEVGVKLLDTHFVEVQLPPNSDSDEDDEMSNGNSIVWKPKNSCSAKKFPLLIGSAEWWVDDSVGLRPEEQTCQKFVSDSDTEDLESLKSLEKKSSSTSMENMKSSSAKPGFPESSSSSSSTENLFGFDKTEPENDQPEEKIRNGKEGERGEEEGETVAKPSKVDNAFTRELMAKLVSVTHKDVGEKPEIQQESQKTTETVAARREVKAAPTEAKSVPKEAAAPREAKGVPTEVAAPREATAAAAVLPTPTATPRKTLPPVVPPAAATSAEDLFDETDDTSDLFSTVKAPSKAVVEKSLFFDAGNDDDLFDNDLFSSKASMTPFQGYPESSKPAAKSKNDLFEDLEEDEDTLFAAATAAVVKTPPKTTLKSSMEEGPKGSKSVWDDDGLFDDVQEDGLFDSPGLFESGEKKKENAKVEIVREDSSPDLFSSRPITEPKKEIPPDDPFGFSTDVPEEGEDLFSTTTKKEDKRSKVPETETEDEDASLFLEKPKLSDAVSVSSSRSSLFEDVAASSKPNRLASVFEKDKTKGDLFDAVDDDNDDELFAGAGGKPSGKEKSSLFEDFEDEDDLFGMGKKSKGGGVPTNKPKESKLFDDLDDADLFSEKPKPPTSLALTEPEPERKPEPKPEPEPEPKPKAVGKLNIPSNLKNRFESAAKRISPGGRTKPPEEKKPAEDSLDVPVEPSTLLKCPSKDRARIPGRRRPQSRRARQEAIRTSGTWEKTPSPEPSTTTKESPVVSPSTDEEDFFKVPELDTNFEKEDQTIFKRDLFEWSKTGEEDPLFVDGGPVLSPRGKNVGEGDAGVFDVEEDNLFKPAPPPPLPAESNDKKSSLFDLEDDDDEDLFSGGNPAPAFRTPTKQITKSSDVAKDKGNDFVDPLGLIKD